MEHEETDKKTKTRGKPLRQYKCALCPYSTTFSSTYKQHLIVHSSEQPFKCPQFECPFRTKWAKSIPVHVKRAHTFQSPSYQLEAFLCSHPGCSYAAEQKSTLIRHSKLHAVHFFCFYPNCDYTTNHKTSLTLHTRIHTRKKPYKCQFESCSYATATRGHPVTHSRIHTTQRPFKCPEPTCEYSAAERSTLKRHQLRHHSDEKPLKCPELKCPFKSKWRTCVKKHVENVHLFRSQNGSRSESSRPRPFPCPHPGCSYAAKQKGDLVRHSKTHTSEKSFFCSHLNCKYSSTRKVYLTLHTRRHTGEKPYKCQFESCSYAATYLGDLPRHTRTHTKERPFKCPEPNCEYSAAQNANLKRHQLTHEPNPNPKDGEEDGRPTFSCPLCEYTGKAQEYLLQHIKRHTFEKLFKCDEPDSNCNFEAKTKGEIKLHQLVHSDEKPFACSFQSCEFRCKVKSSLADHLKRHTEERRYKCELCPYRGKTRNDVRIHIKFVHSDPNLKPFKCPEPHCDSAFKTKDRLNAHVLIHKGEKNYKCSFLGCDYEAVHKHSVKSHKLNIHKH